MDKITIPEPRWVTDLNAKVDKATAAAGIGLTKTITDAMAASGHPPCTRSGELHRLWGGVQLLNTGARLRVGHT